jgi:hypothetical protein
MICLDATEEKCFLMDTGSELIFYHTVPSSSASANSSTMYSGMKRGQELDGKNVPKSILSFLDSGTDKSNSNEEKLKIPPLLMDSKYWLLNYVHNKLTISGSTVIRPIVSDAGTFTANHFISNLIEDFDPKQYTTNYEPSKKLSFKYFIVDSFETFLENVKIKAVDDVCDFLRL